jgi:hypothetical protein
MATPGTVAKTTKSNALAEVFPGAAADAGPDGTGAVAMT